MNTLRRLAAMACIIAIAPAAAAQQIPAVDAALKPLIESEQLAGAVTLVLKDGKPVHASSLGMKDIAAGEPLQMDTIFRAYSMTKPVTAVAMMILWDEGKWKPEDPVSKFVPELKNVQLFKGTDTSGKPIFAAPENEPTIGQLLTHTAGFSYGFNPGVVDDLYRANPPLAAQSGDDFARSLAALPLAYEPGTQWQYSLAMDVQGLIIERLSGMSLPDFMEKRIFAPLRMPDTGFLVPAEKRSRFATLYRWRDGRLTPEAPTDYASLPGFASGGGGLVTTAGDYGRLGQMLLNGGALDDARILSPVAAKTIMTDHLTPQLVNGKFGIGFQQIRPGYQFGYNGVVVTDPAAAEVALGKGSYLWDGRAGTWFWVDPENQVVFVGMIQRVMSDGGNMPRVQDLTQRAVKSSLP